MVVRSDGVLCLKELRKTKIGCSYDAWHRSIEVVVIQKVCDLGWDAEQLHTSNDIRSEIINLRFGDVRLINLHKTRQLRTRCPDVCDAQQHPSWQLMLKVQTEMLGIRRPKA